MIGPLLVTAALSVWNVVPVRVPDRMRPFGQVVVACQIGLTVSPETLARLVDLAPVMVTTALATLICIFVLAVLLARLSGMSVAQSFLASVPTSPVEAAAMALRAGIDPVPVIISQTVRLSAVVLVLPLAIYSLEGWPEARIRSGSAIPFDIVNVAMLLAIGVAGMHLFRLLRVPNPNFLGPLTVTAILAATEHAPPLFPAVVLAAAQIVLGAWLGGTFRRELLAQAGRILAMSFAAILLLLLMCSLAAVAIALAFGLDWQLLVLGAAPGGVVEMVLTAKFLGQDPTLVTGFHLTRIFLFMPNIPWIVALLIRLEKKRRSNGD